MTPAELQQVSAWAQKLGSTVTLGFIQSPGKQSLALEAFGRQMAAVDPRILFKAADRPGGPAPALAIGERIFFQALPRGRELGLFLEALDAAQQAIATRLTERLAGLALPGFLTLYIAPQCPFCPAAVRQLIGLAMASTRVTVTVIDGLFFPDLAARANVLSTPTLILDGQTRWVGSIPLTEVVDQLLEADPFRLSAASLQRLLEEGQAQQIASMMANSGRLFPCLVELLAHQRWSVRLGAMVAAETLAAMDKRLAGGFQTPIWEAIDRGADSTVCGDLLYVIGAIGGPEALARLAVIRDGLHAAAVKDAAAEAIDRIIAETRPAFLS
jgi:hypothetical protein